jgi:CBS domain-containing protein
VLEAGRPLGIFSERDLARKVALESRSVRDTLVRAVMSPQVLYVTPAQTVVQCMALMQQDRVRHLVVVEGDSAIGVISARDILEEVLTQERRFIKSLEAERLVMTTYTGTY